MHRCRKSGATALASVRTISFSVNWKGSLHLDNVSRMSLRKTVKAAHGQASSGLLLYLYTLSWPSLQCSRNSLARQARRDKVKHRFYLQNKNAMISVASSSALHCGLLRLVPCGFR